MTVPMLLVAAATVLATLVLLETVVNICSKEIGVSSSESYAHHFLLYNQ